MSKSEWSTLVTCKNKCISKTNLKTLETSNDCPIQAEEYYNKATKLIDKINKRWIENNKDEYQAFVDYEDAYEEQGRKKHILKMFKDELEPIKTWSKVRRGSLIYNEKSTDILDYGVYQKLNKEGSIEFVKCEDRRRDKPNSIGSENGWYHYIGHLAHHIIEDTMKDDL